MKRTDNVPCPGSRAPSPLAAALGRVALSMFVAGALLAPTALREAEAAPCGDVGASVAICDAMTKIDLDFLNDNVEPIAAWNVNSGVGFPGDEVAFKVYALTDDARFYQNVTSDVKNLRFKLHGFRRQRHFRYDEHEGDPRWVLDLRRERLGHITGTIEVRYRCTNPHNTYTTSFLLVVIPER